MFSQSYDIIVVGAGHAGCEAAAAAANLGSRVLLITMDMTKIAQMSCNPAMGGIAKGQIVREIDAMGGYSGIVTDKASVQFRMLNRSKGPAMWSPRAQCDRALFTLHWRSMLEKTPNLDFWQDGVDRLIIENGKVCGVHTSLGIEIRSKAVVITSGTFLNGVIHIGERQLKGGRIGEKAAYGITEQLVEMGMEASRMKTGTPPRIDGRSLDYTKMELQEGDENPVSFSYLTTEKLKKQLPCWIVYTNDEVHHELRKGFDRSPMFNGTIQGIGPRYCPSIEDKINRFSERIRHQLFVEPEGWDTCEIYLNGFSTSLPEDVQMNALLKIPGFANCKVFRPGYAIEYDFFPPTQLYHSLESKLIPGLFLAGQVNGTTGYEEAACQGLMAGINAHQKINTRDALVLKRSEAYIGVLIDDLVTKGTEEPYRMFTSRAEFRILLRQDNADLRLTPIAHQLGLASLERLKKVEEKLNATEKIVEYFKKTSLDPLEINDALIASGTDPIKQKTKMFTVLSRPQINIQDIIKASNGVKALLCELNIGQTDFVEQAEIQMKYEGYIFREQELAKKMERLEDIILHDDFDYRSLGNLSAEAREKLSKAKPQTIAQASRISGITPSDISVLLIYLGR